MNNIVLGAGAKKARDIFLLAMYMRNKKEVRHVDATGNTEQGI